MCPPNSLKFSFVALVGAHLPVTPDYSYVIKKLNLRNASSRERRAAEQEAQLLSQLKHPNIVTYKESWEGGDGLLYIVMGFCEGGDLYQKLKEQKGRLLPESQVVEWFVQIAMALQYLHEKHILHRDLKTQNVFLTRTNIIKVGDLGIARVLENHCDMASTLIGTPYYMSPELFSNKPYNYKSDVWALGCCVYEMATLKHAFNAKDMNSLVYRIIEGKEGKPTHCLSEDELSSSTSSTDKSDGDSREGKGHTNEMSDLVQLMTQTLKLDSKESCEDLLVPDPVSEFKLHRKYRDTLILHGKVAEEAEELHFKELSSALMPDAEKIRRIVEVLRADVIRALGIQLLEQVYDLLEEEDELEREVRLREHMGEKYTAYSVKARQLKFFEENVNF
ncbi:hypothetical protein CB1_001347009 [Camelus ferus]|nr:hypothetical protein CB1_001347009 [Camelus ferus]